MAVCIYYVMLFMRVLNMWILRYNSAKEMPECVESNREKIDFMLEGTDRLGFDHDVLAIQYLGVRANGLVPKLGLR